MNRLCVVVGMCSIFAGSFLQAQSVPRSGPAGDASSGAGVLVGLPRRLSLDLREYQRAVAAGDSLAVAEAAYLIGKRYSGSGDFLTAQRWFMRSLRIREPRGPSENLGKLYLRMAELAVAQSQFAQALIYAHRALSVHRQVGSAHGLMSAYVTLAGIHQGGWLANNRAAGPFSPDSAFLYLRQAEPLTQSLNRPVDVANLQRTFGEIESLRDPRRAIPYLERSLVLYDKIDHKYNNVRIRLQLAGIYLTLGQAKLARPLLEDARARYQSDHVTDYYLLSEIETGSAHLCRLTGNWQQAYAHQQKANEIRYAALNADRNGAIEQLGIVYETEKREARIQSQQNELALRTTTLNAQRQLTWATAGLLVLAVGAGLVLFRLNQKNQRISQQNAGLVKEQSHRIKNNLQAVSNLLSLQSVRLADGAAKRAVEDSQLRVHAIALLHQRLYNHDDDLTDVDLAQYVPEVVSGVLTAYGLTNVLLTYDLTPLRLHADRVLPVGLILNEVVTNACKYAFPDHPTPTLAVSIGQQDNTWRLTVEDNGPGFAGPVPAGPSASYGLRLIQLQTRQLRGTYTFANRPGVYFELSFPVENL